MFRTALTILGLAAIIGCQAKDASNSQVDFAKSVSKALPKLARCSQVSEVEKITVRETLLVKFTDDLLSGTYHFATGEKSVLTDAGFQHLSGKVASTESKDNVVTVNLSNASLSVYFDEDFAPEKNLNSLKFDLKEKKISFVIADDARETVVGGCTFE